MLVSVRKVFELVEIKPESIQFKKHEFNATNVINALTNEPKKCPITTAADWSDFFQTRTEPIFHALVIAGALKGSEFLSQNEALKNEWFIKCKNSYRNDPTKPGIIQNFKICDQRIQDFSAAYRVYYFTRLYLSYLKIC